MTATSHKVFVRALLCCAALVSCCQASDNGLVRTPPLGWMSWMYYTTDITEEIIKGVADELVSGGYKDAGYRSVCACPCVRWCQHHRVCACMIRVRVVAAWLSSPTPYSV